MPGIRAIQPGLFNATNEGSEKMSQAIKASTVFQYLRLNSITSMFKRILTIGPLLFVVASPSNAGLLLNSDFESGDYYADGWKPSGNIPTITGLPDPTCGGSLSLKVPLDYYNDAISYRTELSLGGDLGQFAFNKDYWVGFAVYLSPDWQPDFSPGSGDVFMQFHRVPDSSLGETYGGGPSVALVTSGEDIILRNAWDTNQLTEKVNGISSVNKQSRTIGKWQAGIWTTFVLHVKFSYEQTGTLEVWKNGEKVFSKVDNIGTAYNDQIGPYLKMGIYKSSWNKNETWAKGAEGSGFSTRLLYIDEVRVGDSSSFYNEVAPQCGSGTAVVAAPPLAPTGLQLTIQ
jgi:hypothetical protein